MSLKAHAEKNQAEAKEERSLKAQLSVVTAERDRLHRQLGLIESLEQHKPTTPPTWLTPKSPAKGHRATLNLMLTDTHFDEVVDPDEIQGLNAYNREIADIRLRTWATGAVKLAKHYLSGVKYDGVCLMLGGDIFSGNIHEELQRSNEDTLFGSLLYWIDPMRAALELLAREFGRVHVAATPGNHGRMTRKPIAKQRAADNLDWLFARLLQREMSKDDRFSWNVPTSADTRVKVYNTVYNLTHGDQFRGGSGISGALAPLLLGQARKSRRQSIVGEPYDYLVVGHWHQTGAWKGIIVGGAMKGYDEYAYQANFDYEPAQQSLWLTTPERGITFSAAIACEDRKEEGW